MPHETSHLGTEDHPRVLALYTAAKAGGTPQAMNQVRALAGRGLQGDRYADGGGTFSGHPGRRDVTLVEIEAIDAFEQAYHLQIDPAELRRNIVTRGVRLNELIGVEFRIGGISVRGLRLCEPCYHLARLTRAAVLPGFVHRGGLYAEILEGGVLAVGDPITVR